MSHNTSYGDLRLCHLICPGLMGGAEKVVLAGCQALLELGVPLELAVIREARAPHMADRFLSEARVRNVPTFDGLLSTKRIDLGLYRSLRDHVREEGFQFLHTHGYKALLYGARVRSRNTKLIHTQHGDTAHRLVVRIYAWLAFKQLGHADAICAVSREMQQRMAERGLPSERITLVENMLATPMNAQENVKPLPPRGRALHLVAIGRLSREKGLNVLLQALAKMSESRPQVTFVGAGPERDRLQSLAAELHIQDTVKFAGFHDDIKPFLADADAFVMPSFREGFPMGLIEAGVWGLPVIATRVGGIPTMVEHGKNGLLCEPNDCEDLLRILNAFSLDAYRYGLTAREMADQIKQRFSPATWAENTIAVYNTLT